MKFFKNSFFLIFVQISITYFSQTSNGEKIFISKTKRDRLFATDDPIICEHSLKGESCNKLCFKMKIPYDELKDVNGRDVNPKQGQPGVAREERIDSKTIPQKKIEIPIPSNNRSEALKITTNEVGDIKPEKCKFATMWIHGAAFDKGQQGMRDELFGGAFNRMKHLAVDNSGLYYSPDIDDFENSEGLAALVNYIHTKSCPNGKIVIACGSAGTRTCWDLAENKKAVSNLSGLVFIATVSEPKVDITQSEAIKAKVPIIFATGENDGCPKENKKCGYYKTWEDLALKIYNTDKSYPIRTVVFKDGGHMTPLRMLDWRQTLNCIFTQTSDIVPKSAVKKKEKENDRLE